MMQEVVMQSRKVNASLDFVDQSPAISKVPTRFVTALPLLDWLWLLEIFSFCVFNCTNKLHLSEICIVQMPLVGFGPEISKSIIFFHYGIQR